MARKKKENMVTEKIILDDCKILYRNFSGKERQYNPKGKRNFLVVLPDELADHLKQDGWNVRFLQPRDEEEDALPVLQVSVSYANFPPKIYMISGHGKKLLDEDTIDLLDVADIDQVDLTIRPYNWEVKERSGNIATGVKAYAEKMYVTISEDPFESKYYDVPDVTDER